ncbi:hypothetical protein P1X14_02510 [Sphingomonas sp. AOB5]|uniref:hypothetical protein n=1 Tax=Sphingomonas sp. AOB5 TaxID=3034017 RepID=UPI0023F97530|nr:hypothetical protein [Sphingomonas sp. AOB5]MDF7774107.1 hypothetical protein [Sphingomonas sp. AOB5]
MLAVSGLSILLAISSVTARPADDIIFACDVGANRVEVIREGRELVYRFGAPGGPALRVVGDPAAGTLSNASMPMPIGEARILRFRAGVRSYIVYHVFDLEPGGDARMRLDQGGVLVLEGDREVERLACRMGDWRNLDDDPLDGQFSDVTMLETFPRDPQPLYERVLRVAASGGK